MENRFLDISEVQRITGNKSRVTIWRWCRDGNFPKPHKLSAHSVGWLESEVQAWIDEKTGLVTAS